MKLKLVESVGVGADGLVNLQHAETGRIVAWDLNPKKAQEIIRRVNAHDDYLNLLNQSLPLIDAYRRVSGGDGDICAMNIRAALALAEKGEN